MIKKLLLAKFNIIIFLLFAFSGTSIAQSYQINGITLNSSNLSCSSFDGKKIISIGDGVNFASLRMDSNLDLTSPNTCVLGPIQLIINNNANIDFSVNNSDLKLPAGSSITFTGDGTLYSGTNSQCSASDRIYIGGVLLASCEGKPGAISFDGLVNQGGYNIVNISPTSASVCGSGSFSFTATAIPSAAATIKWYDSASGGNLLKSGDLGSSNTYTTPIISTTTTYYAEATIGSYTIPRKAVTVTVNPLPDNTISTGFTGGSFCIGIQATLTYDADDTNGAPPYTLSYTDGTTTYSQNIPNNDATTFNVSATTSTGYTLISITNINGCVNLSPSNKTANVTFRPNPTASISGTTAVCLGATSPNVTFTNPQAAGITITYTINGGADQTVSIVAGETTNVPVPTTTAGSFVYALVSVVYSTNPSCKQALTGSATVTINALPTAPTIAVVQPTCTLATGTITVTAPTGMNYSIDGSTYTNTSGIFTSVAAGSYSVTAKNASGCISSASSVTIISPLKTWNGSSSIYWNTAANWTPSGVPISSNCVTIPNVTNAPIISGTNFVAFANTLTISSGGSLLINPTNTITITDFVNVNLGGSLTFENTASLVQINDVAANSGNIIYKRTTTPIFNTDYVYWSSPVAGFTLGGITTGTLYYSFNGAANSWVRRYASTSMTAGTGYIVRGAGTGLAMSSLPAKTVTFTGEPNNGVIKASIGGANTSNLIGNPYPSAIDAEEFLKVNAELGTLYFWTHNIPIQLVTNIANGTAGSGAYAYTSDDYATYNLTGGNVTVSGAPLPTGKIAAGQGFIATGFFTGDAVFNNSMRLSSGGAVLDNTQFFKQTRTSKTVAKVEKSRIWLNLANAQGAFKQILVGYVAGATNAYDRAYDGVNYNGNKYVNFYSVNNTTNLTVQGRALPFDITDEVPLGYSSTIVGEFSISIDKTDGLFVSQDVFLEDKLLNVIHDLKQTAYVFSSDKGQFNERFVLRYKEKEIDTVNLSTASGKVLISNKNKQVKVNSLTSDLIDKVFVYDVTGRILYKKENVNSSEFSLINIVSKNQMLLVKSVLQNGQVVISKIIY